MAQYDQLFAIINDENLQHKVQIAVLVAADNIRITELPKPTPDQTLLRWARRVFLNPEKEAVPALRAIVAANASASIPAILGASDGLIQANVTAVVPLLAQGLNSGGAS